jgi:hypothetical protein
MNLDKLNLAIENKYELIDINNQLILPKQFVVFTFCHKLFRGIVLRVNKTTTTILSTEIDDRKKYSVYPNEQMVINSDSITDELFKYDLLKLYEEETTKKPTLDYERYIICTYKKYNTNECGMYVFKYDLQNSNRHNKSNWKYFLSWLNSQFSEDIQFYVYCKNERFILINNEFAYKNLITYHEKDIGVGLKKFGLINQPLKIVDNNIKESAFKFYFTKSEYNFYFTGIKVKEKFINPTSKAEENIVISGDNWLIQFLSTESNTKFMLAWNEWINGFSDNELTKRYLKIWISRN